MKLLLPTSVPLDPTLPDGVTAVAYDPTAPIPAEHRDAEAIVVWSTTPAWAAAMARDLPQLRWVQSLSAGTDALAGAGLRPETLLCSGVGLHDITVAEHALALVLAAARRLDVAIRADIDHRWARELAVGQPLDNATSFGIVRGSHVVIWGLGSIGQTLAGYLGALGASVTGIARSAGTRHGVTVVTDDDLAQVLPTADVLVCILPATPRTERIVNAEVLALLPEKAWLVNVGRGATVDEPALIEALESGSIAGAALDVTSREPLPADDPLWDAPHLILTPHSAGGRPLGADARIESNLAALLAGRRLEHVVER